MYAYRCVPHVRGKPGAKSFVDDLILGQGSVRSRAAPSLRSIESQPLTRVFVTFRPCHHRAEEGKARGCGCHAQTCACLPFTRSPLGGEHSRFSPSFPSYPLPITRPHFPAPRGMDWVSLPSPSPFFFLPPPLAGSGLTWRLRLSVGEGPEEGDEDGEGPRGEDI